MDEFYFVEVMARLVGVLLLFMGAVLLVRRWMGVQPGRRLRQLKVVESIRLAPRQSVHLVQAGDHYFLVGATDASIALISPVDIEDTQSEMAVQLAAPALVMPELPGLKKFQQILEARLNPGGKV